ncbi:MAG: arylsulfatase [Bacteroidota bacterium]
MNLLDTPIIRLILVTGLCVLSCQRTPQPVDSRPNIVLVMVDDMGYSDIGCYGGEISTPNIDELAQKGLRFSQFYNTARCCPTRASLMTGLFPHQTGIGHMTLPPTKPQRYEGWTESYVGYLNRNCVTMAEVLGEAGYHTYMSGKWHLGYHDENHWPRQRGFDRYYGIIPGASSYFRPQGKRGLTLDNTQLAPPDTAYYTTDAFTSYAIDFLEAQQDDQPFFLYLAYNAPHWPLHAKEEDIERFRGRYEMGWDSVRAARFARQKDLGLLDPQVKLSPRDERVRPWAELTQGEKDSTGYRMAVYAAQIYSVDQNLGRLTEYLKNEGKWENTVFMFLSDNGGCAEMYDELGTKPMSFINDVNFGGAVSYGIGWANASNTPFHEYKVRTYEGGIATPLIIHWPKGMQATPGSISHEATYLIDLMPTLLELTGASYPKTFHQGDSIHPLEGNSLLPLLTDKPYNSHEYLVWEHQGFQAIRKGKWKGVKQLEDTEWELYDLEVDRTETNNIADLHPTVVADLASYWEQWAKDKKVLPKKKAMEL